MSKPISKFAQADLITQVFKLVGEPSYGAGSPEIEIKIGLNLQQLSYLRNVLGTATVAQAAKAQKLCDEADFTPENSPVVIEEGRKSIFLQALSEGLHEAYKRIRDVAYAATGEGAKRKIADYEASRFELTEKGEAVLRDGKWQDIRSGLDIERQSEDAALARARNEDVALAAINAIFGPGKQD